MTGDTGPKVSSRTTVISRPHVVDERRRIERAAALVAGQQFGALPHRLVHARLKQHGGRFVDHGAHVVGLVGGVAVFPGQGLGHHQLGEAAATASCTSSRLTAVQRWPEFLYEPCTPAWRLRRGRHRPSR
jgi:hypothetical protein